jgi:hypothetical protein
MDGVVRQHFGCYGNGAEDSKREFDDKNFFMKLSIWNRRRCVNFEETKIGDGHNKINNLT